MGAGIRNGLEVGKAVSDNAVNQREKRKIGAKQ